MKWITFILCAAIALIVLACNDASRTTNSPAPSTAPAPAGGSPATTPDELAAARTNFQKNCVACHGETGEGGLRTVEGKRLKVPSFKAPHALKDPDEDFIEQIHKGGEGMPAFKDKLSEREIQDLVKFIRKEFQGK
jgi:mono/diheme cytochrome c family protein